MYNDNRGNRNSGNHRPHHGVRKSHAILPPPEFLERYDDIVPGSAEKLIDLAEIEQKHRHNWENRCLKTYNISYRFGQILGFLSAIAILVISFCLYRHIEVKADAISIIKIINISGFSFLAFASLIGINSRKFSLRPSNRYFKKKKVYNNSRGNYRNKNQNR